MVDVSGFSERLHRSWAAGRFVCVGLDPDLARLPRAVRGSDADRVASFCREIVAATAGHASSFKLNSAFFERMGVDGARLLEQLIGFIKDAHPDHVVILDAKRGDVEHTNRAYAEAVFDVLGADAVTVHPYMGRASLEPFLERADKGVIVMAANSTPGADEFQSLLVGDPAVPLYEHVGRTVARHWNTLANCAVTAGATAPEQLARLRRAVGEMPILLLGLGAQGGDLDACLRVGRAERSFGLIPSSSRAILYASSGSDFADAAHAAAGILNRQLGSE